jgi:hypothetical protein
MSDWMQNVDIHAVSTGLLVGRLVVGFGEAAGGGDLESS